MGEVDDSVTAGGHDPQDVEALHREVELLRDGLIHRAMIGQATGLLAGRLDINTDVAWRSLVRMSSHTNVKLRDVARVLVAAHNGAVPAEDQPLADQLSTVLPSMVERVEDGADGLTGALEPGDL